MNKLRILHIAEAPGGVERYIITLLTKLKENHYNQFEHILVCSDSYDREKFKGLVEKIENVSYLNNTINIKRDLKSMYTVRKLIIKYQPDIIYCHSSKAGAIGRIASIKLNNRVGGRCICIYNAHGWSFNMKGESSVKIKLYVLIEKLLAPLADRIVCISSYEERSALEHKICKSNKLQVIYNGIDFNEYKAMSGLVRNTLSIPDDAYVVGTVGRLAQQKAPDVFVKAALEIKKIIDNAFFIMVGDGGERTETEKLIKEVGLTDCFLITGWVNNPLDYIDKFDAAVLLSRWEGFGLVLPEYMIMGKPVVATQVDAIPDLITDGVNGLLIESDDYKAAAKSVIKIKENLELRNYLIENGKKIVEECFDVARTAHEHAELFRTLA